MVKQAVEILVMSLDYERIYFLKICNRQNKKNPLFSNIK